MSDTTLVEIHKCVKKNGPVLIFAEIVRRDRGDFVVLVAHGDPKCKGTK